MNSYGKQKFPYGFKVQLATGMLAEEVVDKDTWFLKASCKVKHSAGLWEKNLECEAKVTGADDAPEVISFMVY